MKRAAVSVFVATAASIAALLAQTTAPQYGADSPQAVIAALQKPIAADDLAAAIAYIAPASRQRLAAVSAAVAKADTVALVRNLMAAYARIETMLQMEKSNVRRVPFSFGAASTYQITGDRATARAGAETLQFERIQGRWYIAVPAK
jgi:hypothetical protein